MWARTKNGLGGSNNENQADAPTVLVVEVDSGDEAVAVLKTDIRVEGASIGGLPISIMMAVRVPLMTRASPSAIVDSGPSDGGMYQTFSGRPVGGD